MSSPRRESSRSRLSPSSSREIPRNERRTHSGGSRRNSQADPEVPPSGHQHPRTPRTQAPHSGAPTYGSYFYQASPRLSQAFRSHSQPRPRSSAPPYEEVWTCRAPRWRSEIMVTDRSYSYCRICIQGHHSREHHVDRCSWKGLRSRPVTEEGPGKPVIPRCCICNAS